MRIPKKWLFWVLTLLITIIPFDTLSTPFCGLVYRSPLTSDILLQTSDLVQKVNFYFRLDDLRCVHGFIRLSWDFCVSGVCLSASKYLSIVFG